MPSVGNLSVRHRELNYLMDSEGYLLDSNSFYLLDHKNERIQVPQESMKLLFDRNILN